MKCIKQLLSPLDFIFQRLCKFNHFFRREGATPPAALFASKYAPTPFSGQFAIVNPLRFPRLSALQLVDFLCSLCPQFTPSSGRCSFRSPATPQGPLFRIVAERPEIAQIPRQDCIGDVRVHCGETTFSYARFSMERNDECNGCKNRNEKE